MPTASTRGPRTAFQRYRPVRDTSCPVRIDVATALSISGVSTAPDEVADVPITPWTNSGM